MSGAVPIWLDKTIGKEDLLQPYFRAANVGKEEQDAMWASLAQAKAEVENVKRSWERMQSHWASAKSTLAKLKDVQGDVQTPSAHAAGSSDVTPL